MKWIHDVKWNKKTKRKQHTYRLSLNKVLFSAKVSWMRGLPAEWTYGYNERGSCATLAEAQNEVISRVVAKRLMGNMK